MDHQDWKPVDVGNPALKKLRSSRSQPKEIQIKSIKNNLVQPLIIDIVDQLPSMDRQGLHRRKFYKKLKYQIKLIDVEENEIIAEEDITNSKQSQSDDEADIIWQSNQVDFIDD